MAFAAQTACSMASFENDRILVIFTTLVVGEEKLIFPLYKLFVGTLILGSQSRLKHENRSRSNECSRIQEHSHKCVSVQRSEPQTFSNEKHFENCSPMRVPNL